MGYRPRRLFGRWGCLELSFDDMARSRAYRLGEDGIAGISDDRQLLCFAVSLLEWTKTPSKRTVIRTTNTEEIMRRCKKQYSTWIIRRRMRGWNTFIVSCQEYPYDELVRVNATRNRYQSEYELTDTDTSGLRVVGLRAVLATPKHLPKTS